LKNKILQEKAAETAKQKEEKRKKLKPEEQECVPKHQHCPPTKRQSVYVPLVALVVIYKVEPTAAAKVPSRGLHLRVSFS
jgi:hypothetical protein